MKTAPVLGRSCRALFAAILGGIGSAFAQGGAPVTLVIDAFDPAGTRGFSYSGGQIGSVWSNWFGAAFQSLAWDATTDAGGNPTSGALRITANFPGTGSNQFTVINGFDGISPSASARQFTAIECDVRFAPGSATQLRNGVLTFGRVELGMATPSFGQRYFGGVDIPATASGWVHLTIPLTPATDPLLLDIDNVMVHIWGGTTLAGPSTMWVDNLKFTGTTVSGTATVEHANVRQRIDGFGASSAWNSTWSAAEADLFFSTGPGGIGLSLLRSRIAPDGTSWENGLMQMAQARGARSWSAPWSPPASYKTTNNVNGGSFIGTPANYATYADHLANYVATARNTYGIQLDAVSVQNEPNYSTDYESCVWTGQQIHDFVPYLSAALAARGVGSTRILLPESANWEFSLAVPTMNDPATAAKVGILGGHNYGSSAAPVTQFGTPVPKPLWETEHYIATQNPAANGMELAEEIHEFMTRAEANAYHYWWLRSSGTGSLAGNSTATPAKRLYVMGQFSKFIRPGFHRVAVANDTTALVSAYQGPEAQDLVIVAANPTAWPVTQTFDLSSCPPVTSLNRWVTSDSLSLASQPPVSVVDGAFTYEIPAFTIVTFSPGNGPRPFVALAASDNNNRSSFNSAENWNDAAAPSPAKDYTASRSILRSPTAAGDHTFAGHSLALPPQAILRLKGSNLSTITINRFVLDGGTVENGNANHGFTLAGNIEVRANSAISLSNDASRSLLIPANLSGSADLTFGKGGPGTITLAGANEAFTGAILVNGGTLLKAAAPTQLGGNPDFPRAGQLTLDNAGFQPTASFTLDRPNGGVTLGPGGGTLTIASGLTLTLAEPLAGSGSLTKSGPGTLVLNLPATHNGPTTLSAGTLTLAGLGSAGSLTTAAGTRLDGTGAIAGNATIQGTLAPTTDGMGFSGPIAFTATATLACEIDANASDAAGSITAASATVATGARIDLKLNRPGSTLSFLDPFWRVPRSFPLLVTASMSGAFTLGSVSPDAAGLQASAYGSFRLQQNGTGTTLVWTPLPGTEAPTVELISPSAATVSLPAATSSLRLTATFTGTDTTFSWSQVSGPGTAILADSTATDTRVTFPLAGSYLLRATASNAFGSDSLDLAVHVATTPPPITLREGENGYSHPDTLIRGDNTSMNSGARDQFIVGRNGAPLRSLLSFVIPPHPPGTVLTSASLDLWIADSGSGTSATALTLHRLLVPFVEGSGDGANAANGAGSGATWVSRTGNAADPWTSPGAAAGSDYESTPLVMIDSVNPSTAPAGTAFSFGTAGELVPAIHAAAGGASPASFFLKTTTDSSGATNFLRFASSENATFARRPRLTLGYSPVNPLPTLATGPPPAAEPGQPAALVGNVAGATQSAWSLVSGPGTATFGDATQPATTVTFSQPGLHQLRLTAASALGEVSATLTIDVQDLTPPLITVPADITIAATGGAGANVTFTTSAYDLVDGPRPTTDSPASGSLFPVGTTTVTTTSSDAAGNVSTETFAVTVTGMTYATWAATQFTAPELADSAISGPAASPAGDGLTNLLIYALGLPPKIPSVTGITLLPDPAGWTFTYYRPALRSDLTYAVEVSPALTPGSWTSEGVTHERIATGDMETWQARHAPAPGGKLLFRLKVVTR